MAPCSSWLQPAELVDQSKVSCSGSEVWQACTASRVKVFSQYSQRICWSSAPNFNAAPTTGTFIFGYMQGRVLLSMGMWKAVPPGASDAAAAAAKGPPTGRRRCLQWAGPVECPKFRSIGAEAVPPGSERFP